MVLTSETVEANGGLRRIKLDVSVAKRSFKVSMANLLAKD
jgi:hypothetical protein